MALAKPNLAPIAGVSTPRLAPPVPVVSLIEEYRSAASELGIELMPWQDLSARYITATAGDRWLFPEVSVVVARQNGKTELLKPHVLQRLRMGRKILHTAQNRSLPRETFLELASLLAGSDFVKTIRQANGQETIDVHAPACERQPKCRCKGGKYTLVAPRPGVRGFGVDDVILDEVREQRSFELIAGIKPTQTASANRQTLYLSNAGDEDSLVLNDLRRRSETSDRLAYLEWSADPDRTNDDRRGWAEANPALGITIQLDTLEDFYASLPGEVWETEHLCRWVISMRPRAVDAGVWLRAEAKIEEPLRPSMGISMDVSGKRASAVLAWQQSDGTLALTVLRDVTGDPIDTNRFGPDLKALAMKVGVTQTAYDAWTDTDLARHIDNAKSLVGRDYANASENFARVLDSGRLHWSGADQITDDLTWTSRKQHESGAWMAVKSSEERPITASLAAVRAVWLASAPKLNAPQVY